MKEICMCCGLVLKDGPDPVSHGCCKPCLREQRQQMLGRSDNELEEVQANPKARELTGG